MQLDPLGKIHIPIGLPNTLDALKTFVESEGSFSPGFGTYGIYFWLYDNTDNRLTAPTIDGVRCSHGLHEAGYPIPYIIWRCEEIEVKNEICETLKDDSYIVASRIYLANKSDKDKKISLYVILRPIGPAGGSVARIEICDDALLVDGHPAMIADTKPNYIGVSSFDNVGEYAANGKMPESKSAQSDRGECSGAMRFDLILKRGYTEKLVFICPVLAGRYAVRHKWADFGQGALVDIAKLNAPDGIFQQDKDLEHYRKLGTDSMFDRSIDYWKNLLGHIEIKLPDPRWNQGMIAMLCHASLSMNEGAPDVAVINYNVFNRDGMYVANIMQKSGLFDLAEQAIDYFLSHPFNGRAFPEADNPGQILWILGQQWRFTRDVKWLARIYPFAKKIADMIVYYRITPQPHWVNMDSLDFGETLAEDMRQELKPGSCDGYHPEYTEAFDIAGLRSFALLAEGMGDLDNAGNFRGFADRFLDEYDDKFGHDLGKSYGSYSVLWPCQLYPLNYGKAFEQFGKIGAMSSQSWRYFPLATAHQGLFAGNRKAGYGTVNLHLDEEQMQGWYAFDEGGESGSGGWYRARTTWTHSKEKPGANLSVAMPHGWATAEMWLLMRDCLMFEDDEDRIVLLAGIPPEWFYQSMEVSGIKTHYGTLSIKWLPQRDSATLEMNGSALPPNGFILRLPDTLKAIAESEGKKLNIDEKGNCFIPQKLRQIKVLFV